MICSKKDWDAGKRDACCHQWNKDKLVNPVTGRKIQFGKGVYLQLQSACQTMEKHKEDHNDELKEELKEGSSEIIKSKRKVAFHDFKYKLDVTSLDDGYLVEANVYYIGENKAIQRAFETHCMRSRELQKCINDYNCIKLGIKFHIPSKEIRVYYDKTLTTLESKASVTQFINLATNLSLDQSSKQVLSKLQGVPYAVFCNVIRYGFTREWLSKSDTVSVLLKGNKLDGWIKMYESIGFSIEGKEYHTPKTTQVLLRAHAGELTSLCKAKPLSKEAKQIITLI